MSKEERFEEDLENAIKWAASEHNYFTDLSKDLSQLKQQISLAVEEQKVTGIRKVLRDINQLSRSERRLNKYVHHARRLSKTIQDKIGANEREDFAEVVKRIDIEAAHLLLDASRYDGRLVELLRHLEEKIHSNDLEQAQQVIMECLMVVEDGEKWVAALSTDVSKAKHIAEEFTEVYHEDIEGIKQALAPLTPNARIDYLVRFLKNKKNIKRSTYLSVLEWLKEILTEELKQNQSPVCTENLTSHLTELGLYYEAGEVYLHATGGYPGYYLRKAGKCFEKAGEFEKAGDAYFRLIGTNYEDILKTASCYEKAHLWDKALHMYIKYIPSKIPSENKIIFHYRDYDIHTVIKIATDYFPDLIVMIKRALALAIKIGDREAYSILSTSLARTYVIWSQSYCKYWLDYSIRTKQLVLLKTRTINKAFSYLRQAGYSDKESWKMIGDWLEDPTMAAEAYEKGELWQLAAEKWKKAGKVEKATATIEKLVGKRTSQEDMFIEKGNQLYANQKYLEAIKKYEKAKAWDKVGDCYNQLGKGVEAMRMYRRAVAEFREKFGFKLIAEIDLDESTELGIVLSKLRLAANQHELTRALKEVLKLVKDLNMASAVIQTLGNIKLADYTHWRMLGEFFEKLNFTAASAECFVQAGKAEDIVKAVEGYRKMKEVVMAGALSL